MSSKNFLLPFLIVLLASSGVAARQVSPWSQVPEAQFWGCKTNPTTPAERKQNLPIQVLASNWQNFNAKALNIATGAYDQLFKLGKYIHADANTDSCPKFDINACAMSGSPGQESLYCVYTNSFTGACPGGGTGKAQAVGNMTRQLFRISPSNPATDEAFETCVGQLEWPTIQYTNAATFDAEGKIMYVGRQNRILSYNIEAVEKKTQQPTTNTWCANSNPNTLIETYGDTKVTVLTETPGMAIGADVVFSEEPFSSATTDHGYVVSIGTNCNLFYLYKDLSSKINSGFLKPEDQQRCIADGKSGCQCFIQRDDPSFGAGWNYNGHIYVAHNAGEKGVYKVKLFYDSNGYVNGYDLVEVAGSVATSLNDGTNCPKADDPFPTCGDPDGALGDASAITKADCGDGYLVKSGSSQEACSGRVDNPNGNTPATVPGCDVGSASATDQDVCCEPEPSASPTNVPTSVPSYVPSSSPTVSFCPTDIVVTKTDGDYPIDLQKSIQILQQKKNTVTVRLINAWTVSGDTIDSILYKYKEDEWSNKCYEETNVDGDSAYQDITIQCMHTVSAAKLTICVADSDDNPLTDDDKAQVPKCCNDPGVTHIVCYRLVIYCESTCATDSPTLSPTDSPTAAPTILSGSRTALTEYSGDCDNGNKNLGDLYTVYGHRDITIKTENSKWMPYVHLPNPTGIPEGSTLTVDVDSEWEVYVQYDGTCWNVPENGQITFTIVANDWVETAALGLNANPNLCPIIERGGDTGQQKKCSYP